MIPPPPMRNPDLPPPLAPLHPCMDHVLPHLKWEVGESAAVYLDRCYAAGGYREVKSTLFPSKPL